MAYLKKHLPLLTVIIIPLLVLIPVCSYDFVSFDDNRNVYANIPVIHASLKNWWYFWRGPYEALYIPFTYNLWGVLANLSQLLNPSSPVGELDPHLFHTANLLIHLLSTVVLYNIFRKLLDDEYGAVFGALLFAIHPIQIEAVAWVTGLKDLLSGFWCLVSLRLFIMALSPSPETTARKSRLILIGAATTFVVALLSKPSAVVLPLMAFIIGHQLLHATGRQLMWRLLPWLVLSVPVILVTSTAQDGSTLQFIPSLWQRILVAGDAISFYLAKLVLPISFAIDYGRTPQYVLAQQWIWFTGLFPYLLAVLLLSKFRQPWLLTGAGLFIAPLLPVSGIIPFSFQFLSTVTDRYLYLAILGPAFILGWLISRYRSRLVIAVAVTALTILAIRSAILLPQWQDSVSLYQHTLKVNPGSWMSYLNLGSGYEKQNKPDKALSYLQKAAELYPDNNIIHLELGKTYQLLNNVDAAISAYRKAIALAPDGAAPAYHKLGAIYYEAGNLEKAIDYFQKAVSVNPGTLEAATYYADLGMAFNDIGKTDWAISAYREALALNPYLGGAYSYLGNLYLQRNQPELARQMYMRDLEIIPNHAPAYNGLGMTFSIMGRRDKAVEFFRKAIELSPETGQFYNNLAAVYLEMQRYQEAILYADKAMVLGTDNPPLAEALAPFRHIPR